MKTITVKTGFGYYRDAQGHIVSKAELPPGDHPMLDDYTYTELANKASLDALQLWEEPVDVGRRDNEAKIRSRVRQLAIADLKAKGELPEDYQ